MPQTTITEIGTVGIPVGDQDKAVEFFVGTLGFEIGVQKSLAGGAFVHAQYTAVTVDAATVDQLSKYVLDYAPRSFAASGAASWIASLRQTGRSTCWPSR